MNKLASWETLTGTRPTIESDRTIATVSFPLKSAIQRKTEAANVAINILVNPDDAKNDGKNDAKTTSRQDTILDLMRNNPNITLDEIAKEIGVGTTTIDREVVKMAHLVQREGPQNGWPLENY